jgi:hypothetical protein
VCSEFCGLRPGLTHCAAAYAAQVSSVEDKKVVARMGNQTRDEAVECMCWARAGLAEGSEGDSVDAEAEECGRVFSARVDGVVQLWDVHKQAEVSRMEPISVAHELPRSIFLLNRAPGATARLVTCCENGAVNIRTLDEALEHCTADTDVTVKGPVSRMRGAHSGAKLGYGGKENELQLFDIAAEKVEWTAKNVPENFLRLRLPVWVTDLQFLRNSNDRKVAICTAYGSLLAHAYRVLPRPTAATGFALTISVEPQGKYGCTTCGHSDGP